MTETDENVYRAKLAEQAERYEEMKDGMKKVVESKGTLTTEERNLLSVAYKNVIGSRRASWRVLNQQESATDEKSTVKLATIKKYKEDVEKELNDICEEILNLLEDKLLKNAEDSESKVFYQKMKGDYYRYQAEFSTEDKRKEAAENSLEAYKEASDKARNELESTHAIRLGLALNFSVFYYEILNSPERACRLAKDAFDEAMAGIDCTEESSCKDSTLIMQLLRDNLTLWTSDMQSDDPDVEKVDIEDIEDK